MAKKKAVQKTGKPPARQTSFPAKSATVRKSSAQQSAAVAARQVNSRSSAESRPAPDSRSSPGTTPRWTFLTNHSHVLVLLDSEEAPVLREVAIQVGITERAVQRIIQDLEAGGFIERQRIGRRNRYQVLKDQSLRHPIECHRTIGDLLNLITPES